MPLASLLDKTWGLLWKVCDRLFEAERGLLGLAAVAGLTVLAALLALAGSEFGENAVPLGAGALVGGGFGHLVARFVRGRRFVAGALACLSGLSVAMGLYVAASDSGWLELPGAYPEAGTVSGGLFYGFLFGSVLLTSQGLLDPLAPATPGEARERRRVSLRSAVLVGAASLALAVLALVVFAVLALIAYGVAALHG